jgi:hypothetical protein
MAMHHVRFARLLLVASTLALAAWPAATAYATPPTFDTISLYEEFYFPAGQRCDFPIQGVTTGTLRIQHHYDGSGNLIFENIVLSHWSTRVSNALTGESLFAAGPEPTKITYNQDGSITYAVLGLILNAVEPGQGLVGIGAGQLVFLITFDESGVPHEQVVFEAGLHDVDVAQAACDALAS